MRSLVPVSQNTASVQSPLNLVSGVSAVSTSKAQQAVTSE
jgi:hypothetical protein